MAAFMASDPLVAAVGWGSGVQRIEKRTAPGPDASHRPGGARAACAALAGAGLLAPAAALRPPARPGAGGPRLRPPAALPRAGRSGTTQTYGAQRAAQTGTAQGSSVARLSPP